MKEILMNQKEYFHLSSPENKESILRNGIQSNNDDMIFIFDRFAIHKHIAIGQMATSQYSVFQISEEGIKSKFLPDDVAELSSQHQYIILQEIIEPQYITHVIDIDEDYFDLVNEFSLEQNDSLGFPYKYFLDMMKYSKNRVAAYNLKYGTNHKPHEWAL